MTSVSLLCRYCVPCFCNETGDGLQFGDGEDLFRRTQIFVRDKVGVLCEQIIYQNLFFAVVEYA